MKRLAAIFLTLALCVLDLPAQVDSLRLAQLDARLGQYFSLLEQETADVKIEECDALIEAATDPSLKQAIALKIYDHYKASTLMGDDAVAIHMADKWFIPGKIAMRSDGDLLAARMDAEFNRQSLIGKAAPVIELEAPYGETVSVPSASEQFQLLYFYDTDCAKCKLETATLRSLLNDNEYPIIIYAVYVGTNEAAWKQWRETYFKIDSEETKIIHLWDPNSEADLQFKYGVVQTPRMFLVDPEGKLAGICFHASDLGKMLAEVTD